jgi:hypothetical protein
MQAHKHAFAAIFGIPSEVISDRCMRHDFAIVIFVVESEKLLIDAERGAHFRKV